jgi:formylglycine-generating enzyme required for sulfatase activity
MHKRLHSIFAVAASVAATMLAVACSTDDYAIDKGSSEVTPVEPSRPLTLDVEPITVPGTEVTFDMILVQRGSFVMGGADADAPEHLVTLTKDFYIGRTEVTQSLYQAVMDANPSSFNYDGSYPVENVSFEDANTFCQKLSRLTGYHFTLPTEAQWEYAAYGGSHGSHTRYSGGDNISQVGWYVGNAPIYQVYNTETMRYDTIRHTMAVAQKQHNLLGLYDMTGNVREWCADAWGPLSADDATDPLCTNGGERVYRGGSCNDSAQYCRAAHREAITPASKGFSIGFRLAINME